VPIMLSVDALPKPRGYFLLRGRDYVQKRSAIPGEAARQDLQPALMAALQSLPEGILVTDATGNITYANRALEQWLGFEAGGLTSRTLKIGQILYQYEGQDVGRMIAANFSGTVTLQRKDRSLVTAQISQASLGRSSGVSAILRPAGTSGNP
jgi:PAS domain S-box-containing protein